MSLLKLYQIFIFLFIYQFLSLIDFSGTIYYIDGFKINDNNLDNLKINLKENNIIKFYSKNFIIICNYINIESNQSMFKIKIKECKKEYEEIHNINNLNFLKLKNNIENLIFFIQQINQITMYDKFIYLLKLESNEGIFGYNDNNETKDI